MTLELPAQRTDERRQREFTTGDWATEQDSAIAFDAAVPTELFNIYREVRGTLVNPRPTQVERSMRIDRILVPTTYLLTLGWQFGIIGCELKRSGEKIGPPIAQAMDYSRSVFTLEPSKFRIWLDYVFIWPMSKQGGTTGSILAQNRIGSAYGDARYNRFQLMSGESAVLRVGHDNSVRIGNVQAGSRAGSR